MIGERKLLAQLDQMLEDGINGAFAESDYDESRLSRLETGTFQLTPEVNDVEKLVRILCVLSDF